MANVKWIKIDVNVFNNRKIRQIEKMPDGDTLLVIWFKLLCLAGTTNDNGLIYITPSVPFDPESLANEVGKPLNTVKLALSVFEKFGMIEIVDDIIGLCSWDKYQSTEGLEKIREQNRERARRYRDKKKQEVHPEAPQLPEPQQQMLPPPDEDNSLKRFGKKQLISITDAQVSVLLNTMPLEVFDSYCDKIESCIEKGYKIHSHYSTIMRWWEEDTKV